MSDQHTFVYVDDSGDDAIGVSMSAVLIPAECWSTCLEYWTAKRADLERRHGLPRRFEIHSNAFLSAHPLKDDQRARARRSDLITHRETDLVLDTIALARAQVELADLALSQALAAGLASGTPLIELAAAAHLNGPDVTDRLDLAQPAEQLQQVDCFATTGRGRTTRRRIYAELLHQINVLPGAAVITVCADDGRKGTISRVYAHLLAVVDEILLAEGRWGTVIVDGTPSARTAYYRDAHRSLDLAARRILEDEVLRDSSESHFIQMADICAHSAFGARQGDPGRYGTLKDVVRTADGEPMTIENPGFFPIPALSPDEPSDPTD